MSVEKAIEKHLRLDEAKPRIDKAKRDKSFEAMRRIGNKDKIIKNAKKSINNQLMGMVQGYQGYELASEMAQIAITKDGLDPNAPGTEAIWLGYVNGENAGGQSRAVRQIIDKYQRAMDLIDEVMDDVEKF